MRFVFMLMLCVGSAGCVKTDLEPLPTVTRVDISHSWYGSSKDLSAPANVSAIVNFIDGQRLGWTRQFVGSGPPSPFLRANLYDGDRQIGYFAVASGVLPSSHAAFEAQFGKIRTRKVVPKSESNRFLDVLGVGGQLSDNVDKEVRQQIASQPATSRAAGFIEPPAKFQPGDRVRVKVTRAEGTVCLRTKFFREDLYFITFPGSYYVFETIADRTRREAWKAESVARSREWARSHGMAESAFDFPEYQPTPWHEEGPFYESDLELIPNGPNQAMQRTAR